MVNPTFRPYADMTSGLSTLPPTSLFELTRPQFRAFARTHGVGPAGADALWSSLYGTGPANTSKGAPSPAPWATLPANRFSVATPPVVGNQHSRDGHTRKYLLSLADGQRIETVVMRFQGRTTACISSQAGCAMGCIFCATGQQGFTRHLTPGEIVAQVVHANHVLAPGGERLRNLVLMGMGEPLHNYDAVMQALEVITDQNGLAIAPRHITLSTVGLVPGIHRLADEARPFRLAVSLHGANDVARAALVPVARRWPLAELMAACRYYGDKRNRKVFFEWTLIEGQNDSVAHAAELAGLLRGMRAHVNLIPLNPTAGFDGVPSNQPSTKSFQAELTAAGIPSTVRQYRGIDIAAGCGQLRTAETAST